MIDRRPRPPWNQLKLRYDPSPFDAEQDRRDELAELSNLGLMFKLAPAMSTADDSPWGAVIPLRVRKREYMRTKRAKLVAQGWCARCWIMRADGGGRLCLACLGDGADRFQAAKGSGFCPQHPRRPVGTKRNGKPAWACSECLARWAARAAARRKAA